MGRPDLAYAFTKIALWKQVQFCKIVYLDADVVALRALDELFDLDVDFAAAPDIGWPDAFNSGVMVISPNMGDYWALHTLAAAGDSFDGADQGLLNQYYQHRNWHRLSFTYNCTPNAQYQWEPAYRYYKANIAAVHFIGKDKPWLVGHWNSGGAGTYNELVAQWWAVYDKHLKVPAPEASLSGHRTSTSRMTTGETPTITHTAPSTQHSDATSTAIITQHESSATPAESLSESGVVSESVDHGETAPRKFSAPQMEWDATR